MTGLRVAHVQPMTLDLFGHDDADFGVSVRYSVANLALAQARMGMRPTVHLLASQGLVRGRSARGPRELHVDGMDVRFHRCVQPPRSAGTRVRFARQFSAGMLRAISASATDVVHFHGVRQFHLMYAAVAWRARGQGLRLVAQDRGGRNVGRIEGAAQRFGLRRSDEVLAAGTGSLEELRGLGVAEPHLHLFPNGVDREVFHPGPGREPPQPGVVRVMSLARMYEDKDPLTMIAAVAELHRRGLPVELTAVGAGPLRGSVEERARAAGVPATFIEHVPQGELPAYYRAADVLVLTTAAIGEGWNQATLEAMACGLPVVATDVPGVRDSAGGAAVLVPPGKPEAVADAVQQLTGDAARWQRQRERGLARVEDLTWDAIARRLHGLYRAAAPSSA